MARLEPPPPSFVTRDCQKRTICASPFNMASQASSSTEKIPGSVAASPVIDGSTHSKPSFTIENDTSAATPPAKVGFFDKLNNLFGQWYYLSEVLGLIISAAALISICVVVDHYDNEPPPYWSATIRVPGKKDVGAQLTINTLLAILAVIGSTCAMVPVTKGLGQLKYLWFMEQDRKLADLDTFDSASRSKLGSAQLIWKLRLKYVI